MSVTIVVPMLPPRECSPNWHGAWRRKAREAALFRQAAAWSTKATTLGDLIGFADWDGRAQVVMDVEVAWCCRRKRMDDDNCWASLKACRDGIADVLFGGEDRFITQGTLTQTRGDGTVTVTLKEQGS